MLQWLAKTFGEGIISHAAGSFLGTAGALSLGGVVIITTTDVLTAKAKINPESSIVWDDLKWPKGDPEAAKRAKNMFGTWRVTGVVPKLDSEVSQDDMLTVRGWRGLRWTFNSNGEFEVTPVEGQGVAVYLQGVYNVNGKGELWLTPRRGNIVDTSKETQILWGLQGVYPNSFTANVILNIRGSARADQSVAVTASTHELLFIRESQVGQSSSIW